MNNIYLYIKQNFFFKIFITSFPLILLSKIIFQRPHSTTFTVANAAANVTATGLTTGDLGYNAAGSVTANGGHTGDIDYNNNAGKFTLGADTIFTGAINSTGGPNGTFIALGNGTITGAINNLNILEFSGGNGTQLDLNDNSTVNSIVFTNNAAASGTINSVGQLTLLDGLTFNNGNVAGGVLIVNAASTVNGPIVNGLKGIIQINADLTINDPSAGSVNEIDIADNTTYTIDAKNGNVDLLKNNAKIVFLGDDSQLDLINSSDANGNDRTFTLYANLNPSNAEDEFGIVRVATGEKNLTITDNGGLFTIGQDATHRLKEFIIDQIDVGNIGNIVINETIFTKLFSMNSAGKATLAQALNLGAGCRFVYDADGEIVANGITGPVTTSNDGQGTLTIASGNVDGQIGDNLNHLKLVNVGANPVTFSNNVFAPVLLTDNNSALTLANNVIVTGSVKTTNDKKGTLTLGTNSGVTDGIGDNNAALAQVKVGAGVSNLGGNIYSEALALTDNTSELTLHNNTVVNGSVTTTADDKSGKLIFAGDGGVTGNVGIGGAALEEVVFNGVNNIGSANATNFTVANAAANATITGLATGDLGYNAAGSVTANGGFTGDLDYNNNDGTFILGAGTIFTGKVDSTGGENGTFIALGNGTITGAINNLDILEFSGGDGTTLNLEGNTTVNEVVYTNSPNKSGTINVNAGLDAGKINFNLGNADGGTLVINVPSTVNTIINPDNGTIIINADFTIRDPNAGDVDEIRIANNKKYTIDSINGDIDLLDNGAKIIFLGENSELDLINTSAINDRTFTLHANLNALNANGIASDDYGIVRVATDTQNLTIADNGGPFTIGQDNTHRLKNFIIDKIGAGNIGDIVINETIFTKLLSMNSTGNATLTQNNLDLGAGGSIKFGATGTLLVNNVTGNVDFMNNAGTLSVSNGSTVNGTITSTGGVAGILNFIGNGTVMQAIGTAAGNSPATINVQGDNTTTVALNDDVFVDGVSFENGGKLQLNRNLTAPNIDFGANGGILEFKGNAQHTFKAVVANGQTGILNALTTLTATDQTIGTIKTINIGAVDNKQTFTIQVNNDVELLSSPNSSINFGTNDSELVIVASKNQIVTFVNSLKGILNGGGIVTLNGNGNNLTVSGNNGATLGVAGNELGSLNIISKVTITDDLDVHNINQLNINAGADFIDQSLTSAVIANINIGKAGNGGAATYGLDAVGINFDLNTGKMTFVNADSALNLQNSSNADDRTITLQGPLDPGDDEFGIVQLTTGDKKLTIDNGGNSGFTLGTVDHRLKELDFVSTGNGTIDLNVGINVENILLNINEIELDVVNANVKFAKNTVYSVTGDISGNIDFQNNEGTINLADGVKINGTVSSTGGTNGKLVFAGDGEVVGLITNLAMLQAGAGNVSLSAGGNYSITEIQGNGNNDLTLGANSTLTGINTTGGQVLNLIFTNGGSVSGEVGSNAAVGNITVQAGNVAFGNTVNSGNIIVSNGATVQVNNNLTAPDISGENDNEGTLKLNNPVAINITGTVGTNHTLSTVEVANSDATVTGGLNAQNINFSNAAQEATLTLKAASNITNVTTAGYNIHTIAVTDFDTGNGAFGTEDHRIKLQLTGNGLATINTNNFHSSVTTANNGQGNVKLNVDGAIAYDLGSKDNSLATVQFSGNNTVKGDVYWGR
ncbi:MAG: beta strand repeat-containing protein [Rickettsia endosymbiont of Pentastiridius leporinus]